MAAMLVNKTGQNVAQHGLSMETRSLYAGPSHLLICKHPYKEYSVDKSNNHDMKHTSWPVSQEQELRDGVRIICFNR